MLNSVLCRMLFDQKLILAPLISSRIMCVCINFSLHNIFLIKHHLILNANMCVWLIKKLELTIRLVSSKKERGRSLHFCS